MDITELWSDLNPEMRNFFESQSQIKQFKRGEFIYSQGEVPKGIYFVKSGLVGLTIISANSGKEHLLRFFKQGQFFGHRSLFSNEGYHGNAVALELTEVRFVAKSTLLVGLEKDKSMLEKVVYVLSKELRRCEINQLRILENQILPRVAQTLVYLKDIHPQHNWTRQEIANFCASTPSTVIKALSQIESLGYIQQDGRSINILDREALISLQDD